MGNNLDLCEMLGVPVQIECPLCTMLVETDFDDYDIDCGNPNPSIGKWLLRFHCSHCEQDSVLEYNIQAKRVNQEIANQERAYPKHKLVIRSIITYMPGEPPRAFCRTCEIVEE